MMIKLYSANFLYDKQKAAYPHLLLFTITHTHFQCLAGSKISLETTAESIKFNNTVFVGIWKEVSYNSFVEGHTHIILT